MFGATALVAALLGGLGACAAAPPPEPRARAEAWPEADALFHRDPKWLGGDAAFSVDLGGDRVLWLFGDSFVATAESPAASGAAPSRSGAAMVRNSIAIQTGRDPRMATMAFRWGSRDGKPASFFPEDGDRWVWPLQGIRLRDGTLVLFLARLRGTPGEGLGFAAEGWRVAVVDAAEVPLDPEMWHPRFAPQPPAEPIGFVAAQGLLAEGEHILGFATTEPGDHAGHLARWLGSDLAAGRLDRVEWWSGEARGWVAGSALGRATPPAVIDDAAPEFSVHRDRHASAFVHTASLGFGATNLGVRFAERPQGPWTAPLPIYTPPESGAPGILVYAGKAHPELEAGAAPDGTPWLAATYATNTLNDFARLVADTNLYYPRFVRIWIAPEKGTP